MKKIVLSCLCLGLIACAPTDTKCLDSLDCEVMEYCESIADSDTDIEQCRMDAHYVMLVYTKKYNCNYRSETYFDCLHQARVDGYSEFMEVQ